jgi:hypothetical protein
VLAVTFHMEGLSILMFIAVVGSGLRLVCCPVQLRSFLDVKTDGLSGANNPNRETSLFETLKLLC